MLSVEHVQLLQLIAEHSSIGHFPLDNLLNKLDNQNLSDLKEILDDFYEAGKHSEGTYDEGYTDGQQNGYDSGYSEGYSEGYDDGLDHQDY